MTVSFGKNITLESETENSAYANFHSLCRVFGHQHFFSFRTCGKSGALYEKLRAGFTKLQCGVKRSKKSKPSLVHLVHDCISHLLRASFLGGASNLLKWWTSEQTDKHERYVL